MTLLDPLDQMLLPDQAARWLCMSERTFLKNGRSGEIPVFTIGHKVLAHPRTIIAALARKAGVPQATIAASFGIVENKPQHLEIKAQP